jgi:hypothetical protein
MISLFDSFIVLSENFSAFTVMKFFNQRLIMITEEYKEHPQENQEPMVERIVCRYYFGKSTIDEVKEITKNTINDQDHPYPGRIISNNSTYAGNIFPELFKVQPDEMADSCICQWSSTYKIDCTQLDKLKDFIKKQQSEPPYYQSINLSKKNHRDLIMENNVSWTARALSEIGLTLPRDQDPAFFDFHCLSTSVGTSYGSVAGSSRSAESYFWKSDRTQDDKNTKLLSAVMNNDSELFQKAIMEDADINHIVKVSRYDQLQSLVRNDNNIQQKMRFKDLSILMLAVCFNRSNMVKTLISKGVDLNYVANREHKSTAMDLAIAKKNELHENAESEVIINLFYAYDALHIQSLDHNNMKLANLLGEGSNFSCPENEKSTLPNGSYRSM